MAFSSFLMINKNKIQNNGPNSYKKKGGKDNDHDYSGVKYSIVNNGAFVFDGAVNIIGVIKIRIVRIESGG